MAQDIQVETSVNPGAEVPVTPGVQTTGQSAYFDARPSTAGSEKLPYEPDTSTPGPAWNSNRYQTRPATQSDATKKADAIKHNKEQHQNLQLSGNIISVNFNVPYNIAFSPGNDWELTPRRGTSALFDSFSYLASNNSSWNHTLLGWTGEIVRLPDADVSNQIQQPLNKLSEPVHLPGMPKPNVYDPEAGVDVSRHERQRLEKQLENSHGGRIVPVWLTDDDQEGDVFTIKDQDRWRKFAQSELYTLFHYKQNEPTDGRASRKAWADYYKMNKLFADRVLSIYTPGDLIIVHDYNLMLVPSLLRQKLPNVYVGFFLHIPFPSSEYYRCLGRRKEILEGVLGSSMIGFQALSYARHFSSCCTRILGFDSSSTGVDAYGAHVAVEVQPIGIDARSTEQAAFDDPQVALKIEKIREMYAGKKIIIGRDRLDAVRGITQKLQAFELFLKRYPEWEDKVVLIQITSPNDMNTRGRGGEAKAVEKLSELSSKINGEYGSIGFSPVRHLPHYLSREEYFALLRVADVALVTSVRDGMNTMSMEYAICQKENHGSLILSEFSGTSNSLNDAIHVNPWDLGSVADTINKALCLEEEERVKRSKALYFRVQTHNIQNWTKGYIKRLLVNLESFDQNFSTPALDLTRLLDQYRKADKRLFMFDYDGTLTPIVTNPDAAVPSDRVIRTLKSLASNPANAVWIISGRDQNFLETNMGHIDELGLSAEHGCFIRRPHATEWEDVTKTFDLSWRIQVKDTFERYTEKTPGSFVETKRVAVTWHYRKAEPGVGRMMADACRAYLANTVGKEWDVEVMEGKANLEVRPRFVNKGEIVKRLIKDYEEMGEKPEFVLCAGDDFTDEDMFRSLRQSELPGDHVFATTVGPSSKQTLANWHLPEPADVISAVNLLNGQPDASSVGAIAVLDGQIPDSRL